MAAPTLTYSGDYSSTNFPKAGMVGGYFIGATAVSTWSLWSVTAGSAVLDTATANSYRPWGAQTPTGESYIVAGTGSGGTAVTVYRATQSNDVLTMTAVGTAALGNTYSVDASVSPDGSEVAIPWANVPSFGVKVVSTTSGTVVADIAGSSTMQNAFAAGGGRVIEWVGSNTLHLVNTGGTASTLTLPSGLGGSFPFMVKPVGVDTFFVASGYSTPLSGSNYWMHLRVITTTSDTFGTTWSQDYETAWLNSDVGWDTITSVVGNYALMVPRSPYGVSPSLFYLVDMATGDITSSGSTADFGASTKSGAYDRTAMWCGTDALIWREDSSNKIKIWSVTYPTAPTYLRQRQSPVRSPSRVSPVNLRARQTPFIT